MFLEDTPPAPVEPESIEETGLSPSIVEQLALKILYFRGDIFGQDLSRIIGLKFSVIQDLLEALKLQHLIQVKRSLGMGNVAALLSLTEAGRARAREVLESNQYAEAAPVPLAQYMEVVRRQRPNEGWIDKDNLRQAFAGMVTTERTLSQIGPAVSSANSLLLYGKPGDGKTFLIEHLNNLDTESVYLPNAIECQGNIIQLYDPIYHQRLDHDEDEPSALAVAEKHGHDRRWVRCKRPFIVTGGELTLEMLDLRYNTVSKIYEAPFQLKANNGIYLIDDFGRQRARPAEVLNRWIVPMDRRVDYLNFVTGGKMTAPFETFLVFSTNLNPADLGDEAFLRRIQYKMLMLGPAEDEFKLIFENFCNARRLAYPARLVEGFLQSHYRETGKPMRRCHPRDVLTHALNLIRFENLKLELTEEVLDRAYESCFLQEEQNAAPVPSLIVSAKPRTCADYWSGRMLAFPNIVSALMYLSSLRDQGRGYGDAESVREFGERETQQVLARLHEGYVQRWIGLSLEQQGREISDFRASASPRTERLADSMGSARLVPANVSAEELHLLTRDLLALLATPEPLVNRVPAVLAGQELAGIEVAGGFRVE
jgi:DNA-binding MarR family transcriptional regulator